MARNKFDVDEELDQEFSWKDFKRLSQYVVPYKKVLESTIYDHPGKLSRNAGARFHEDRDRLIDS